MSMPSLITNRCPVFEKKKEKINGNDTYECANNNYNISDWYAISNFLMEQEGLMA